MDKPSLDVAPGNRQIFWLYPSFSTGDGPFEGPKRYRYRIGVTERKCIESRRFLRKRIRALGFVRVQLPDSVWTVRGLRRKRRACAQLHRVPLGGTRERLYSSKLMNLWHMLVETYIPHPSDTNISSNSAPASRHEERR
jgi:hypothetical protein